MIAKFWDEIFNLCDEYAEKKNYHDREIVRAVGEKLQKAYDDGIEFAKVIKNKKPENEAEKYVLSIPDIKVYHDNTDDTYFYDLDGKHFDSPEEVLKYMIEYRQLHQEKIVQDVRRETLEFIKRQLKEVQNKTVIENRRCETVVELGLKK